MDQKRSGAVMFIKSRFSYFVVFSFLSLQLMAFTPGQRAKIQDLTKQIGDGNISDNDARKAALALKIRPSEMNDFIVNKLIITADSKGISDILNPNMVAVKNEIKVPSVKTQKEARVQLEMQTQVKTDILPTDIAIRGEPVIGAPITIKIPEDGAKQATQSVVVQASSAPKVAKPKPGVAGQAIVYKVKDGGFAPLDDEDYQNYLGVIEQTSKNPGASNSMFDIILRYQWPTNMIFADSLSAQEKKSIFAVGGNPEALIRGKIQQAHPKENYDVMSIPDTLYQLFVINYFLTHLDDSIIRDMDNYLFDFFGKFQSIEGEDGHSIVNLSTKKGFLDASRSLYTNPRVAQGQFVCNCAFGAYYAGKANLSWQQMAADLIAQIISNYTKNKSKIPNHGEFAVGFDLTRMNRELQGKNLTPNGIVDNMLKFEANAHQQNKGILVRAMNMFQQEIEVNGKKQMLDILDSSIKFNSVDDLQNDYQKVREGQAFAIITRPSSYGLYPFTGAFYCIWDMPYFYALTNELDDWSAEGEWRGKIYPVTEDNYFSGLMIDKSSYIQDGEMRTLFLIPPFSAFTQLWGHDSLYHALSRAAQNQIPSPDVLWDTGSFDPFYDQHQLLFIQMDPLAFAAKFSEFVSNNAILLKVKQGLNLQAEQAKLRKNLDLASKFYDSVRKAPKVPASAVQQVVQQ